MCVCESEIWPGMWLAGRIWKEGGRIILIWDLEEDSVFKEAGEQRVKHMLAITVRRRQLRLGWLRCEFCGMLASLKLSQNQTRKGTMRLSWLRGGGDREEEVEASGRWGPREATSSPPPHQPQMEGEGSGWGTHSPPTAFQLNGVCSWSPGALEPWSGWDPPI